MVTKNGFGTVYDTMQMANLLFNVPMGAVSGTRTANASFKGRSASWKIHCSMSPCSRKKDFFVNDDFLCKFSLIDYFSLSPSVTGNIKKKCRKRENDMNCQETCLRVSWGTWT